jgi:hypothetical protein
MNRRDHLLNNHSEFSIVGEESVDRFRPYSNREGAAHGSPFSASMCSRSLKPSQHALNKLSASADSRSVSPAYFTSPSNSCLPSEADAAPKSNT